MANHLRRIEYSPSGRHPRVLVAATRPSLISYPEVTRRCLEAGSDGEQAETTLSILFPYRFPLSTERCPGQSR